MARERNWNAVTPLAAGWALAALGVLAPSPAHSQQVLLQGDAAAAKVALTPFAAPAALGSRAELTAKVGGFDTSFVAAIERGGAGFGDDAWSQVFSPTAWTSDEVRLGANWALAPTARLSIEAGDHERRSQTFANPLVSTPDEQLAVAGERYLRVRAAAQADRLDLQLGAESSTTGLDTATLGAPSGATHLWTASRRLFASLAWRPSSHLSFEAGQAAQSFAAGWRGGSAVGAEDAYLTPSLALTLTPWSHAEWRFAAEETLSPIDPAQLAAYAQVATAGAGAAPQPDRGWRYALRVRRQLPGGVQLTAEAADWRLASVTELGPVGAGEAPVSIGPGERQQVALNLAAPLSGLNGVGLAGATVTGEARLGRSQVLDPFTGQRRPISGETPYRASLSLSGALPAPALSWSLTAQADGPQSLYQMAQVTYLGATAGLGGALTYGAGPVKLSLQIDNLLGGGREVTTLSYAGSRAEDSLGGVARRRDDARAVRIALRRGL